MFHGKKTYLVAACAVLVGVLEATDWAKFWDDPKAGVATLVMGLVMAAMRWWTTQTTVTTALHSPPPEPGEQ